MIAIRKQRGDVRRVVLSLLVVCLATAPALFSGEAGNASTGATAQLSLQRTIRTTPFVRSAVSMRDHEGSAYVGRDNALWLVDDNAGRIYVVNPSTGVLKRVIGSRTLADIRRYRGTRRAGTLRSRDLESAAYDAARDRMYVFVGNDCQPSADNCRARSRPTAFRFDRVSGRLRPHSYQPLAAGTDPGAAAWNPDNRRVYIGAARTIRSYSFTRNSQGAGVQIEGLHEIRGMDFNARGTALFVAHHDTRLSRVDWETKSVAPGWPQDLSGSRVRDARGVEQIRGKLFVSDGYDHRPPRSRLRYAVFVFG